MTKHVNMTQDKLIQVWTRSAKAKASSVKAEGNLYAAFAKFATDNSLDADAFTQRTKSLEETLQREASNEALKKAVRSTSSSARAVVANALEQGRSVMRDGKVVGKSRLEQEKKAVAAGHKPTDVMEADTNALKSMVSNETDDAKIDHAMNLADALKAMCEGADDALLADIAYEIVSADARLAAALRHAVALPLAA